MPGLTFCRHKDAQQDFFFFFFKHLIIIFNLYFTSPQMQSSFPFSLFVPWDQVTPGLDIQSTVARNTHSSVLTSGQSRRDNKMWALKISRYILITFLLDGRLPFPQLHQRGLHKLSLMSLWHIGLSGGKKKKKVWSRKSVGTSLPWLYSWHDQVERQKPHLWHPPKIKKK